MTQEDISRLDHPNHYKKRESPMNAWLNVIYKMMADGCSNELIYFYIKRQKAFHESERNLADYIYLIEKIIFQTEPRSMQKRLWNGCYHLK